jgi:hypothetical protein
MWKDDCKRSEQKERARKRDGAWDLCHRCR